MALDMNQRQWSLPGSLADFFADLFPTAAAMSSFVRSLEMLEELRRELPGDNVSAISMAEALAERMMSRGLLTQEFFQELSSIRPGHLDMIFDTALEFDVHVDRDQAMNDAKRGREVIRLDPEGDDLVALKVVSRTNGSSWNVSLSKHRVAKHAARDIFAVTFLGADKMLSKLMYTDEYRLCQGEARFEDEILGDFLQEGPPVHIERRQVKYISSSVEVDICD